MKTTATTRANAAATRADMYQEITNKFIEALQGGVIPWRKPWSGSANAARSYASGRPYSVLNQMYIYIQADKLYNSDGNNDAYISKICGGRFLTWSEVQAIEGAKVRKGSKAFTVTFFKMYQPKDENGNPATVKAIDKDGNEVVKPRFVPVLKWYKVFSEFDVENLPQVAPESIKVLDPIAEADKVINEYIASNSPLKLEIKNSNRAYYSPSRDIVVVPERAQYNNIAEYYSTTFHELTHSTGHASRLARFAGDAAAAAFGSEEYSREELVAEMGAAMCLGRLQIEDNAAFTNSAAYVQGWLKALKNDNKMIFWASSRAEKAVKYIFGEREETPTDSPDDQGGSKDSNSRPEAVTETAPEAEPQPATTAELADKLIKLHVTVEKAEKIGGLISEIVQEESYYLNGTRVTKDINQATKVTAAFAEMQRGYILHTVTNVVQAKLNSRYPGKYIVSVKYQVI